MFSACSDALTTSSHQQLSKSIRVQIQSTTWDFWFLTSVFRLSALVALGFKLHALGFRISTSIAEYWANSEAHCFRVQGSGIRVQSPGLNVWGSCIKVWDVGCMVWSIVVWVWCVGFMVHSSGFGVWNLGLRLWGLGCRVQCLGSGL